jgi:hypothetical protein
VVTVIGTGFTGSTTAWVGNAKNALLQVLTDTQALVTVPAGATTGAIAIFNPTYAAFTASAFNVAAAAAYRQQGIQSFAPSSGPVGTVVTLNGTGFTGTNVAWVGNAKNGAVRILSDSQMQVTIPAGATSGAIGVLSPAFAAFTATSFTVQ